MSSEFSPLNTEHLRQLLRSQMPVAQQYAYFDHAAVSPLPKPTSVRIAEFLDQATHQGDILWPEWSTSCERTRDLAAGLLSCDRSEIALVPNTTHGIGLIAEGLPWKTGDNLVVPDNEFPSNLVPWRNLKRRGVDIRLVPAGPGGAFDADDFEKLIDSRTRLVSLSWVGFSSGFRCNLPSIVELAHDKNCLVLLDSIQGLGAFPLNVQSIPVDFAVADGHKWLLGPEGAGLLYIRKPLLDILQPLNVGWNSLASAGFDPNSIELKTTAARYEGGSSNMMGMLGLGASLSLLMRLGCNSQDSLVERAILENVAELSEMLQSAGFFVEIPESPRNRSGILGIRWNRDDVASESSYQRARRFLLNRGVVLSVRGGRLRAATHAYNNHEDFRRLVEALVDFRQSLD